jgi:hypothetical protein
MPKYIIINNVRGFFHLQFAKKFRIAFVGGIATMCGVLSAINRVLTVLQKAICEQLMYYYITAFCMVHGRQDRKAVLCRP